MSKERGAFLTYEQALRQVVDTEKEVFDEMFTRVITGSPDLALEPVVQLLALIYRMSPEQVATDLSVMYDECCNVTLNLRT